MSPARPLSPGFSRATVSRRPVSAGTAAPRFFLGLFLASLLSWGFADQARAQSLPDTGISGVYEVMVGTDQAEPLLEYFAQLGFRQVDEGRMSAAQAERHYGVNSALRSYRLQNGGIDSHGLVRILQWRTLQGEGVGYAPPETIGQRLVAARTGDIYRLWDVYRDARARRQPWFPVEPIFDDLYGMSTAAPDIINRRVGVREMAVYGEFFNHVFFQRYGYQIPGYGTVSDAPLKTSEFTHHSFIVKGELAELTRHYSEVLGFRAEAEVSLDGDFQPGPQRVFDMAGGVTHYYIGFVSPNNVCGKLKFFVPRDLSMVRDRSADQRIGTPGITLHSLYTPRLAQLHRRVREAGLQPTALSDNEFGERAFLFTGPDGVSWQVMAAKRTRNKPLTVREFERVNN